MKGVAKAIASHFIEDDLLTAATGMCPGCPGELAARVMLKVLGRNVITFRTPGCQPIHMSRVPGIPCLMTNIASNMTGASRYMRRTGRDDVTIVCFVGDGATADVGFQPLSGAASRGEHILYICNDNEAYMNTGIQSSSVTPQGSWTSTTGVGDKYRGKQTEGKYMPLIMLMHGIAYVATATMGYYEDYVLKLEKAKEATKRGMAYIHLHTPCSIGWRAPADKGIEMSRLAVQTHYFPLWEAEDGKVRFTQLPKKPKPLMDLLKMQKRFSHINEQELARLQKTMDNRLELLNRLADE